VRHDPSGTTTLATFTAQGSGQFSVSDLPTVAGTVTYTAAYTGNAITASATSATVTLTLLAGASLTLITPTLVRSGAVAVLSGRLVVTAGSPAGQYIHLYYKIRGTTQYVYLPTASLTSSTGTFSRGVRLYYSGYFYASHTATATVGTATSPSRYIAVD